MATELQIFQDTTTHCRPERVLYYFDMVEDLKNRICEHIGTNDWTLHYGRMQSADIYPPQPAEKDKPDYSKYYRNEKLSEGTNFNHVGVALVPSGYYHFWGYVSPLRNAVSIKDLEEYPIDDRSNFDVKVLKTIVQKAHSEGRIVRAWVGQMYEDAWQIRGYEEFLMDLIERPSWAECLLERLMQRNIVRAKAYVEAGVDWIMTGDDVANQNAPMFSFKMWKTMMLSRWKKVWQLKNGSNTAKIWYHSDGNVLDMVGAMVDAGLDILNPIQPECLNIDKIYADFGHVLTFDGGIGTQTTMPFGTPTDVHNRVEEVFAKYGQKGGLILSPSHVLEPEVPIENIEAFCDACRRLM